ncbi:MAG TPA: UDP-N-acetylglucosamine 1-carboxyvinyltransferase [Candidatus Binatia bacterium]|nr:UDP-N-acetylglucosamine 1-carboxyvinyltransferase [Candidatus Binatia bacterium]
MPVEEAGGHVLLVDGGRPLHGRISVSGSKNASLPVMAASLLTTERVELANVPVVSDTAFLARIIRALGGSVDLDGDRATIQATTVGSEVPQDLGRRIRGSIVLLGALLARSGAAVLPRPGGDDIGARRVEQHLRGLRAMGAEIEETSDTIHARAPHGLSGTRVVLDLPTVTGTENIMLAAATAMGTTEILNAAREPHVQDLGRLLNAMGARVSGAGTDEIVVDGVSELQGCVHRIVPDYLEAGTYAFAVAATGGDVTLDCSPPQDLTHALLKLEQAGVEVETGVELIRVRRQPDVPLAGVDLGTWVHPGFPTDLQAQYLALMTQAQGPTLISEYLFENRFHHVPELVRMGARISVHGREALVEGPSRLHGEQVRAADIRSGAALVIAALCASGRTCVRDAWHIDRGYQDLVGKLRTLGAQIARG